MLEIWDAMPPMWRHYNVKMKQMACHNSQLLISLCFNIEMKRWANLSYAFFLIFVMSPFPSPSPSLRRVFIYIRIYSRMLFLFNFDIRIIWYVIDLSLFLYYKCFECTGFMHFFVFVFVNKNHITTSTLAPDLDHIILASDVNVTDKLIQKQWLISSWAPTRWTLLHHRSKIVLLPERSLWNIKDQWNIEKLQHNTQRHI